MFRWLGAHPALKCAATKVLPMRGFCPRCKEYRSDDGTDTWDIDWSQGIAVCGKCGAYLDLKNGNQCEENNLDKKPAHPKKLEQEQPRVNSGLSHERQPDVEIKRSK